MAGGGPFGWCRQPERADPSGGKCRRTDGTAQDGGYHALDGSEPDGNVSQSGSGAGCGQRQAEAQKHLSEKVKDQEMLGSSTSYHSQEAYQKWQSALNEYERLKKEQERVRQELLLLTGFSPDSPIVLEKMPLPDVSRAALVNPQEDRQQALGNNYELRSGRMGNAGSNQELHKKQRQTELDENQKFASLETLGDQIRSCEAEWEQPVRRNRRKGQCGSLRSEKGNWGQWLRENIWRFTASIWKKKEIRHRHPFVSFSQWRNMTGRKRD